jgi:hypothetical protein
MFLKLPALLCYTRMIFPILYKKIDDQFRDCEINYELKNENTI